MYAQSFEILIARNFFNKISAKRAKILQGKENLTRF